MDDLCSLDRLRGDRPWTTLTLWRRTSRWEFTESVTRNSMEELLRQQVSHLKSRRKEKLGALKNHLRFQQSTPDEANQIAPLPYDEPLPFDTLSTSRSSEYRKKLGRRTFCVGLLRLVSADKSFLSRQGRLWNSADSAQRPHERFFHY